MSLSQLPEISDIIPHICQRNGKNYFKFEEKISEINFPIYAASNIKVSTLKKLYEAIIAGKDINSFSLVINDAKLAYKRLYPKVNLSINNIKTLINDLINQNFELTGFINEKLFNLINAVEIFENNFEVVLTDIISTIKKDIDNYYENLRINELHSQLKDDLGLSDYPSLFPLARSIKRKIIAHIGPTNSGKTYDAMASLITANSGVYLAPLRLMPSKTTK